MPAEDLRHTIQSEREAAVSGERLLVGDQRGIVAASAVGLRSDLRATTPRSTSLGGWTPLGSAVTRSAGLSADGASPSAGAHSIPPPATRLAETDVTAALADVLRDRYTLERELGRGGMATVYLAREVKHGREVALKVLRPELAAVLGRERFLAEIGLTARLDHPHRRPIRFESASRSGGRPT